MDFCVSVEAWVHQNKNRFLVEFNKLRQLIPSMLFTKIQILRAGPKEGI